MICGNTSYLNVVILKKNDRSEHFLKNLFIKDLISWQWKNKKNGEFGKPGNSVFDKFRLI